MNTVFKRNAFSPVGLFLLALYGGCVVASQPYPWLTPAIRSKMGVRAQRLLRADY